MKAIFKITIAAFLASTSTAIIAENNDDSKNQIVVTAQPLKDTEAELKACIARKCSPDQDIKASLAHAENLFVEGQYRNARSILVSSLGRNRKYGGQYPIEVSDLLRANGNVAAHLGETDAYRISVLDMRNTLKDGLPQDDYRILGAELEVGDSRLKLGYPAEALTKYSDVESRALDAKLPFVAATARMRQLSMLTAIAQKLKDPLSLKTANMAINAYISHPTPGAENYALVAEILKSRLDRLNGASDSTDKLIAKYAALGSTTKPILIFAKPVKVNDESSNRSGRTFGGDGGPDSNGGQVPLASNVISRYITTNVENRWVDVGFWINPEGKVEEPEILRNKGAVGWAKEVLKSIESRQYTPTKQDASGNGPGFYIVERYTLTADQTTDATGTHLRQRSPVLKIEGMDLSAI